MNIYCTLFDSNYMDKGMVLYHSLCRCEPSFRLYVFAFDEKCREILEAEHLEHLVIVSLSEFETPELLRVKKERSRAEYCWTCTPWTIRHVLDHYHEPMCTYIDADMMFFSSATYVFDAMRAAGCSTLITPQRLGNNQEAQELEKRVGRYCVEFNTFMNDSTGREALDWWANACLRWCFYSHTGKEGYGDQLYLDEFPKRFSGVYICEEWGVGLAPWNAEQVELASTKAPGYLRVKESGREYPLVLVHFAMITHLTRHIINVASGMPDQALHKMVYDSYVDEIRKTRDYLAKQYHLDLYLRRSVSRNPFIAIYHKFISPIIRVRQLSDIYKL